MKKLNIGCGKDFIQGYINIDIQPLGGVDLAIDVKLGLPFEDESIDEICCYNFIHILSKKEWREFKKEITRVLKPRGKLCLVLHDADFIFRAFLEDKDGEKWDWWRQCVYGAQLNEHDFIKNMFNYKKLTEDLWEEGMVDFVNETPEDERMSVVCHKQKL